MNTLPKPILPVGGLMVVVVVVGVVFGGLVVVVVVVGVVFGGGVLVVLVGVETVRASVIGVPFRSPVTTAFESVPKKSLNSPLILSTTLLVPWLAATEFICDAWLFKSVFKSAWPAAAEPIISKAAKINPAIFITIPPLEINSSPRPFLFA